MCSCICFDCYSAELLHKSYSMMRRSVHLILCCLVLSLNFAVLKANLQKCFLPMEPESDVLLFVATLENCTIHLLFIMYIVKQIINNILNHQQNQAMSCLCCWYCWYVPLITFTRSIYLLDYAVYVYHVGRIGPMNDCA